MEDWLCSKMSRYTREHSFRLVRTAASLPKLKCFVTQEYWTEELLVALYNATPNIKTLVVPYKFKVSFNAFTSHLSSFRHLEVLSIPTAESLKVGFTPLWCRGAYDNPGANLTKAVEEERREAEERVAEAIFEKCSSLKELWFKTYTQVTVEEFSVLNKTKELKWSRWPRNHRDEYESYSIF